MVVQRLRRRPRDTKHRLDGYRVAQGNAVALLVDGAGAFPRMLDAIAEASRSIVLESYIYANDATGKRFRDALIERARAGVAVRVLVDGVGSLGINHFFAPLVEAGGKLLVYRPPTWWRPPWSFWKRDHRKILVVDDRVGFIGGLNIADNYAPEQEGGGGWHDIHARVEGPAARELTKVVNRTWRRLTRDDWNARLGPPIDAGDVPIQVLESRLTRRHTMRRAYLNAIRRARQRICITNAYFVPDQGVRRALRNAASRGVEVQLLLAGRTDIRSVQYASRALYAGLMRIGVQVFEWNDHVLHAKSAVIDGHWCAIGSYNMDRRSLVHNLEANIVCIDTRLGQTMTAQFEHDISHSQAIDLNTWHRRPALEKLLEQLFFKLRYFL
jgi:cardiolipin synthase